jgi:hypothetical protein
LVFQTRAVHDEVVAATPAPSDPRGVRAGVRLGHAERYDDVAGGDLRQAPL